MTISGAERSQLMALDAGELYANLAFEDRAAINALGIQATPETTFATRADILGDMHAAGLWEDIVAAGQAFFEKLWVTARGIVCDAYAQLTEDGGAGEMLDELVQLILEQLGWGTRRAYLVVRTAIKLGLNRLCGTMSAMPTT